MENINVDKIFREYGLEVQQVEPYVYKVLNTEKEIYPVLHKDMETIFLIKRGVFLYRRKPAQT